MDKFSNGMALTCDKTSEFYIEEEEFAKELIEGNQFESKKFENILLPPLVRNLSSIKNFELRPNDTFVVGYPKSGTTWVEEIVWLLQNNLDFEKSLKINHFERVYFIDMGLSKGKMEQLNEMTSNRVFKSHLPIKYLPDSVEKLAKLVYVVRNPKDMLVSYFHFAQALVFANFSGSFELFVSHFFNNKLWYGSWWEQVKEYKKLPNIHFVQYEELLERPVETIKSLASYLDKNYSVSDIEKLISFTSIDKMKNYSCFNFDGVFKTEENNSSKFNFFRKGQIGNWTEHFSLEQSKQVDELVYKHLNGIIDFKYFPSNNEI
uniref:Sulfotransferase-like protein 3 n=1 Tax=Brachionus rotundiformis TaxID=96890 RepID=A0A7H9SQL9_9BILA|nr:sulfotransferase-like protein 3 [Brachionus rotundiformis]